MIANLQRLGIQASLRMVDSAQYTRRLDGFDYDIIVGNFAQSNSPGNEQRDFWGSEAAGREGSQNLIGIKDKAIDKLVDHVIFAKDRAELVAATNALDRVLLWNDFVVPQWYSPKARIAYWNRFGQPVDLACADARLHASVVVRQGACRQAAGGTQALRTRLIRALGVAAIAGAALALAAPSPASAEAKHGLSAFGDLSYPADFQHFAYANPDAPKGGTFSLVGWGGVTTFDSLNNYILKGDAAQGLELLFDTLMARAADEPDAVYGLVAKSAEVAPDGMSVTFTLRPEAKFADGTPLTADDVAFSFETLKTKGHPLFRADACRRGEG